MTCKKFIGWKKNNHRLLLVYRRRNTIRTSKMQKGTFNRDIKHLRSIFLELLFPPPPLCS